MFYITLLEARSVLFEEVRTCGSESKRIEVISNAFGQDSFSGVVE
jgi:hypothetical protein